MQADRWLTWGLALVACVSMSTIGVGNAMREEERGGGGGGGREVGEREREKKKKKN